MQFVDELVDLAVGRFNLALKAGLAQVRIQISAKHNFLQGLFRETAFTLPCLALFEGWPRSVMLECENRQREIGSPGPLNGLHGVRVSCHPIRKEVG
jgi:hypothetical protein